MNPLKRILGIVIIAACTAGFASGTSRPPAFTPDGFAVPQPDPVFVFPRDHGSHPEYKIEWWYVTGHLAEGAESGTTRRYGFQATFFRSAAPRATAARPGSAMFGHANIHLAHMALIDLSTGEFLHRERLNRDGWDAAASTETLAVRNGDWSLDMTDASTETMRLRGGVGGEARYELVLRPLKPLVKFGQNGYSRKGAAPTAASYYLTFSRLEATGTLTWRGEERRVAGHAWLDHEYSSSQLDENQVGWDWLSAQLDDGREIMFYALRQQDGTLDSTSRLTWIDIDGTPTERDYRWEVLSRWRSPRTGVDYPQRVRLTTSDPQTGREVIFIIAPLHPDQELGGELGGVTYWEGACEVRTEDGRRLGSAYLELTGYDKALTVLR